MIFSIDCPGCWFDSSCYCFQGALEEEPPHEFVWDADMAETVVATLKHKSPYCVGAAAAALSFIGGSPRGVKALLKAGAVPALVRIIQAALPPLDIKKEPGVFQRYTLPPCGAHDRGFTSMYQSQ